LTSGDPLILPPYSEQELSGTHIFFMYTGQGQYNFDPRMSNESSRPFPVQGKVNPPTQSDHDPRIVNQSPGSSPWPYPGSYAGKRQLHTYSQLQSQFPRLSYDQVPPNNLPRTSSPSVLNQGPSGVGTYDYGNEPDQSPPEINTNENQKTGAYPVVEHLKGASLE
jgi:hypothetical protein